MHSNRGRMSVASVAEPPFPYTTGSLAFGSFQHVWKSVLGVVLLSFFLSLVAVILAAVALKNPAGRSGVSDGSLPASQRSFGSNLSTGKYCLCG